MELFRELAEEGTRAVTVVTHATKNLDLADKVCVMGRGGELCFFGPPDDAPRSSSASTTFDGIYTALDDAAGDGVAARVRGTSAGRACRPPRPAEHAAGRGRRPAPRAAAATSGPRRRCSRGAT